MQVRIGGAWVAPVSAQVYVGGKWRGVRNAVAYVSGAWRNVVNFATPITLTIAPSSYSKSRSGAGPLYSDPLTATPTGGWAPFTYAWSITPGTSPNLTFTAPSSATTTLGGNFDTGHSSISGAVATCVVTDSLGTTASASITGTLSIY